VTRCQSSIAVFSTGLIDLNASTFRIFPNTESTIAQTDDERSRLLLHGRAC